MAIKDIKFPREKDYVFENELGQGACGVTAVLYDPVIDCRFVCKKYSPVHEDLKKELFTNFVSEIKLLYLLNHTNIVRVFTYYLYPEKYLGYILMEHVQGKHIDSYLRTYPEKINEIFAQVIEGFYHLEINGILHRDIRPMNLLVSDTGIVKIIDFGFGKRTETEADFDKSISLNWWCAPPQEFKNGIYDFSTEVYFIGKLFEGCISDTCNQYFKHTSLLKRMCAHMPNDRIVSFDEVHKELFANKFSELDFEYWELEAYRNFSGKAYAALSKIESNAKYFNADTFIKRFEDCYKNVMLETYVSHLPTVLRCIIDGEYFYKNNVYFDVKEIKDFLDLFRASQQEKRNVIISNLQTKLDAVTRYNSKPVVDDDIPF